MLIAVVGSYGKYLNWKRSNPILASIAVFVSSARQAIPPRSYIYVVLLGGSDENVAIYCVEHCNSSLGNLRTAADHYIALEQWDRAKAVEKIISMLAK